MSVVSKHEVCLFFFFVFGETWIKNIQKYFERKHLRFPINFKPLNKARLWNAFSHLILFKGNSILQTLSLTSLHTSNCRAKASSLFPCVRPYGTSHVLSSSKQLLKSLHEVMEDKSNLPFRISSGSYVWSFPDWKNVGNIHVGIPFLICLKGASLKTCFCLMTFYLFL